MRQLTILTRVALMLTLGVASVCGQPGHLTFSGTSGPSPAALPNGAVASASYDFAGNGILGAFTFHSLSASAPAQVPPASNCAIYGSVVAGEGVFRFADGSLLMVNSAQGSDCIQFLPTGPVAHCIRIFKIAGGTGQFKSVPSGGTITLDETLVPASPSNPILFAATGTGTISGAALDR